MMSKNLLFISYISLLANKTILWIISNSLLSLKRYLLRVNSHLLAAANLLLTIKNLLFGTNNSLFINKSFLLRAKYLLFTLENLLAAANNLSFRVGFRLTGAWPWSFLPVSKQNFSCNLGTIRLKMLFRLPLRVPGHPVNLQQEDKRSSAVPLAFKGGKKPSAAPEFRQSIPLIKL